MKIETFRQVCAGRTDRQIDRVTPWAPLRSQKGDFNNLFALNCILKCFDVIGDKPVSRVSVDKCQNITRGAMLYSTRLMLIPYLSYYLRTDFEKPFH